MKTRQLGGVACSHVAIALALLSITADPPAADQKPSAAQRLGLLIHQSGLTAALAESLHPSKILGWAPGHF